MRMNVVMIQELAEFLAANQHPQLIIDISDEEFEDESKLLFENASRLQAMYLTEDINRTLALLDHPDNDPNHRCHDGNSQEVRFCMRLDTGSSRPFPLQRKYDDGVALENATLLHLAILNKDEKMVQALCNNTRVDIHARVNLVRNKHLYYKFDNSLNDNGTIDNYTVPGEIAVMWINRDAIPVTRVCDVTPLHLAFRIGNQNIVNMLLKAGADFEKKDSNGEKPMDYFEQSQREIELAKEAELPPPGDINEKDIDDLAENLSSFSMTRYKPRLLVGEADFSYAVALLRKHRDKPTLGESITATEYASEDELLGTYASFEKNRHELAQNKVTLLFNVDGRHLHDDPRLNRPRYPRIHFNCPHDKSDFNDQTLPPLVAGFFLSATQKQITGDRVHIALPKPPNPDKRKFYEGYVYGIFEASAHASYRLIKKRKFGEERYPGYKHRITGRENTAAVTESCREYIFEKTDLSYEEIKREKLPLTYCVYNKLRNCLPEYNTDNDSSEYEEATGLGNGQ